MFEGQDHRSKFTARIEVRGLAYTVYVTVGGAVLLLTAYGKSD